MEFLARIALSGFVVALKATAILATGFLVFRALPRTSASARHLAALLALLGAALVPALSPVLPRWEWRILPGVAAKVRALEVRPAADPASSAPVLSAAPATLLAERVGFSGVSLPVAPAPVRRRPVSASDILAAVALLWALGASAMLARLVAGLLTVRSLVRRARPFRDASWSAAADEAGRALSLPHPMTLLVSPDAEVPLTAGVFRPVLVLPEAASTWGGDLRRVVLLHELAHVRRRDTLARIAAETVAALYWFHPLAHAAVASLRREGERAADDLVLASGTRPSEYASHLVAIVRGLAREPERWALAMARPSQVEERVRAILDPALEHRPMGAWQVRLAASALVAGAAAVGAVQVAVAPRAAGASFEENRPSASEVSGAALPGALKDGIAGVSGKVALASRRTMLASPKRESGSESFHRGKELHEDGRYLEAAAQYVKAVELGYREDTSAYNAACAYARAGHKDDAFVWLNKSIELGFDAERYLRQDDDLDSLRKDPRFAELKKTARAAKAEGSESARALRRFERLSADGSKNGARWYEVGKELLDADRLEQSEKAFRMAASLGYRAGASTYNAACALARDGKVPQALDTLDAALEAGFDDPSLIEKDDDLDALRGDPRLAKLKKKAEDLSLSVSDLDSGVSRLFRRRSAWREEVPHYASYAKAHPESGRAHYNLGYAQLLAERPDAALPAFARALELGYRKPATLYNLACTHAQLREKDKAFDFLFQAIDAGYDSPDQIRHDEDLDSLRGDARFKRALERAKEGKSEDPG